MTAAALNPLWPAAGPAGAQCGTCRWRFVGGPGRPVDRCRRHRNEAVSPRAPACPAYTAELDCLQCGACCREAYHAVEVAPRDPFNRLHPDLVERDENLGGAEGPRRLVRRVPTPTGTRCACLGDPPEGRDYRCTVYADRPRTCRDFEQGGRNCVEARRRVGLTP